MNLFTKRFGLVLAGVVGVGAIAALAIGATFALFNAQSPPVNQTFTAGTVSFNGTSLGTCTTSVGNMEPGDSGTCSVEVSYNGSLPAYIGAEAGASGPLANELTFAIGGVTQTSSTPVLIGNSVNDGNPHVANVDYTLSSSAGNGYQGASATVSVTFFAVQCSNNGLTSDGALSPSVNDDCALQPASWSQTPVAGGTTNGVSVLNDQSDCTSGYAGSPCFGTDNEIPAAGGTTTLTVGIVQDDNVYPDAVVTLRWNGNLTFVSQGDTSATCTSTSPQSETCTYTDAAHGPGAGDPKEDNYTFNVGSNTDGTVITTDITVQTSSTPGGDDGGTATAQAFLTVTS